MHATNRPRRSRRRASAPMLCGKCACAVKLAARQRFKQVVEPDILPRLQRLDLRRGFRPRPVDGRLQPLFIFMELSRRNLEDQGMDNCAETTSTANIFSATSRPAAPKAADAAAGARLPGRRFRPRPRRAGLLMPSPDALLLVGLVAARAGSSERHNPGLFSRRCLAPAQAPSRSSCILGNEPTVPPDRLGFTASGRSHTETRSPSLSPPGLTLFCPRPRQRILGQSRRLGRSNEHIPITGGSNPADYVVPASTFDFADHFSR